MAIRRVEGQRLDVILQRLRESDVPASIPGVEDFPVIAKKETTEREAQQSSTESLLIDFIMPIISDPGIFQDNRAILLLEYLRDDVLPHLDESEELTSLATQVIDDEIARHDLVREKRQSGIAA